MGSLGLPATAMAVRSAFALLCFALICGLAASSVGQSETETELKEGEAAGNKVLVEQALESRVSKGARERRGKKKEACRNSKNPKECRRQKTNNKPKKTKGKGKGRRNRKNRKKGVKSNGQKKK